MLNRFFFESLGIFALSLLALVPAVTETLVSMSPKLQAIGTRDVRYIIGAISIGSGLFTVLYYFASR